MKIFAYLLTTIITGTILVSPALAGPGLVVTTETQELAKNSTSIATLFMDQNSIKIVDGSQEIIFDSSQESITILDHTKKQATIITRAELEMLKQQIKMMMLVMETQLQNLSTEQQEAVKKNMEGLMPAEGAELDYDYRQIKTGVKVQSWSSTQYEGFMNGVKKGELFIADYDELGYPQSDFVALEKMASFMREMLSDFGDKIDLGASGSGFFGFGGKDNPIFTKGIPVKMIEFSGDQQERIVTITDIQKQDLDSSTFSVPADYQKSTLQEQLKGMLGR